MASLERLSIDTNHRTKNSEKKSRKKSTIFLKICKIFPPLFQISKHEKMLFRLCFLLFGLVVAQQCPPPRRDYACMTHAQRMRFANAYLTLSNPSNPMYPALKNLVQSHAIGFSQMHTPAMFLVFHRWYLDQIEQLLRTIDPCVSVPYWNYGARPQFPFSYPPFGPNNMGSDGVFPTQCVQDGPFAAPWLPPAGTTCLTRQLVNSFPTGAQFAGLFLNPGYLSFSSALQALHNMAHVSIGGIAVTVLSPEEPLFWLLHAYTDYIWSQAMAQSMATFGYPFPFSTLIPFGNGATAGQVMAKIPWYKPSQCRFTIPLHTPVLAMKCYTYDTVMHHIFNTPADDLLHIPQNKPHCLTDEQEQQLLDMWNNNPWEHKNQDRSDAADDSGETSEESREAEIQHNDSVMMFRKLRDDTVRLEQSITNVTDQDLLFGFDMGKLVDVLQIEPNCQHNPTSPPSRPPTTVHTYPTMPPSIHYSPTPPPSVYYTWPTMPPSIYYTWPTMPPTIYYENPTPPPSVAYYPSPRYTLPPSRSFYPSPRYTLPPTERHWPSPRYTLPPSRYTRPPTESHWPSVPPSRVDYPSPHYTLPPWKYDSPTMPPSRYAPSVYSRPTPPPSTQYSPPTREYPNDPTWPTMYRPTPGRTNPNDSNWPLAPTRLTIDWPGLTMDTLPPSPRRIRVATGPDIG